jgi:hypothetical protein
MTIQIMKFQNKYYKQMWRGQKCKGFEALKLICMQCPSFYDEFRLHLINSNVKIIRIRKIVNNACCKIEKKLISNFIFKFSSFHEPQISTQPQIPKPRIKTERLVVNFTNIV